jgi:selenocysteine-specific translation elongation factor
MIGFIVEGHMEAEIISHICKKSEIRRLQINGANFPVEKICARIAPQINMLRRKKCEKIIVIVDREQRKNKASDIEMEIVKILKDTGIETSSIIVTCPDRNFESWIAPFVNEACELVADACTDNIEGKNGKALLRDRFRSVGKTYVATVDGVKLFKLVNPSKLSKTSESFCRFYKAFDYDCWWMKERAVA